MRDAPRKDRQQGTLGDIRRENSAGMFVWAAWGLLRPFLALDGSIELAIFAGITALTLVRLFYWARLEYGSPKEESLDAAWGAQAGLADPESFGDAEFTLSAAERSALWAVPLGYCAAWLLDLDVLLAHAYALAILGGAALGVVHRSVTELWAGSRLMPRFGR